MDMPVDLPRSRKTDQSATAAAYQWLEKPLNMMAVIIGVGLVFWAINWVVLSANTVSGPSAGVEAQRSAP